MLERYQQALLSLLPKGLAWDKNPEGELGLLMLGLAEEFARIDADAKQLIDESLPSQVQDLLARWEQDYALPDSCTISAQTIAERRNALLQKYKVYGSQSREFLTALATAIGFDITITEFKHRRFGDPFGTPYYGLQWNFVIDIDVTTLNPDPMLIAQLECVFYRLQHAHKLIRFSYPRPGIRTTQAGLTRITKAQKYRAI